MKYNLKNKPKLPKWTPDQGQYDVSYIKEWLIGFEEEVRLFVSIHENEGNKIDPKLMRMEILGDDV